MVLYKLKGEEEKKEGTLIELRITKEFPLFPLHYPEIQENFFDSHFHFFFYFKSLKHQNHRENKRGSLFILFLVLKQQQNHLSPQEEDLNPDYIQTYKW